MIPIPQEFPEGYADALLSMSSGQITAFVPVKLTDPEQGEQRRTWITTSDTNGYRFTSDLDALGGAIIAIRRARASAHENGLDPVHY